MELKTNQTLLQIHSIYNHPHDKLNIEKLDKLISSNSAQLLIGDLNAKYTMIKGNQTNTNGRLLYDFLLRNSDIININNNQITYINATTQKKRDLRLCFCKPKIV